MVEAIDHSAPGEDGLTSLEQLRGDETLKARFREVPHTCDVPDCPGCVNQQRLEMFNQAMVHVWNFREFLSGPKLKGVGPIVAEITALIERARNLEPDTKTVVMADSI